jgi:large repetitive protein
MEIPFGTKKFFILVMVILFLCAPLCATMVQKPTANDMKITTHANTAYTGKLSTSNAKSFTITTQTKNGKVVLLTNGKFKYTPNKNFVGTDTFKYKANNGKASSRIATVTINVTNNAPTANDMKITTHANKAYTGNFNTSNARNFTITTQTKNGKVVLLTTGKFKYTPNKNFVGTDTFKYKANNGEASSRTATVTINVKNNAPTAKDMKITTHANTAYTGYLNITDQDNDKLSSEILAPPVHGDLTLNSNGTYNYTPNKGFIGTDQFTYNANDGILNSNTATININITNTPPVAHNVTMNIKTLRDGFYTFGGPLNGTDVDNDNLTYKIVANGDLHAIIPHNDVPEFYSRLLMGNWSKVDGFTYCVNDGFEDSNIATVIININMPPQQN